LPRNQKEHRKNSARKYHDGHGLYDAKPTPSEFLAATTHESSAMLNPDSPIATNANILPTFATILPSVSSNSDYSATMTNSGNIASTTR
jgi:hypothetical protein